MIFQNEPDGFDRPTCFAVGVFDGVHLGHRRILEVLRQEASSRNAATAVFTFPNHPVSVLRPGEPLLLLLTGPEHKRRLLERYGVQLAVMVPFTQELAAVEADQLLRLLREEYQCRALILGEDGRMGKGGVGGPELKEKAAQAGIDLLFIPRVEVNGVPVSSSAVREAVYHSRLGTAADLLGRYFSTFGNIVQGAGRGRELGFPTLNLDCHREARPPFGVYAGWVLMEGREPMPAAANIGVRPTFHEDGERDFLVEAHVIGGDLPDLTGQEMELVYVQKVRDERFFPSSQTLIRAIAGDVEECRRILAQSERPCSGDYAVPVSC